MCNEPVDDSLAAAFPTGFLHVKWLKNFIPICKQMIFYSF